MKVTCRSSFSSVSKVTLKLAQTKPKEMSCVCLPLRIGSKLAMLHRIDIAELHKGDCKFLPKRPQGEVKGKVVTVLFFN